MLQPSGHLEFISQSRVLRCSSITVLGFAFPSVSPQWASPLWAGAVALPHAPSRHLAHVTEEEWRPRDFESRPAITLQRRGRAGPWSPPSYYPAPTPAPCLPCFLLLLLGLRTYTLAGKEQTDGAESRVRIEYSRYSPPLKFRFRMEAFRVGGGTGWGGGLWKEPRVKFVVKIPPFSCLFSAEMGRSRIGRVKCGFASPARKGSQACLGGWGLVGGVSAGGGGLRQWEQHEPCPSRPRETHRASALLWETEAEAEQDFLFCLQNGEWAPRPGGEGCGEGRPYPGPSPGCIWMLATVPSHPPRHGTLNTPPPRVPSINTRTPCLNPTPTPADAGPGPEPGKQDLSSQASLSYYRNLDILELQESAA